MLQYCVHRRPARKGRRLFVRAWRVQGFHFATATISFVRFTSACGQIIAVSNYGKWELTQLLGVADNKVEIYEAADEIQSRPWRAFGGRMQDEIRFARSVSSIREFVRSAEERRGPLRAYAEARKAGVSDGLVLRTEATCKVRRRWARS
jgi:hypothetical protein